MCTVETGIRLVLDDYNARDDASTHVREYGWLFWFEHASQSVIAGQQIQSQHANSINLYDEASRKEIIGEEYQSKTRRYLGDFHAHPKGGQTWVGQLPSPQDVVNKGISVAGSLWALQAPINVNGHEIDSLPISPELQIVQSLFFGDLIVLQRGPDWSRFSSVQEQEQELGQILARYSKWHQNADDRLGCIVINNHEEFFETWSAETESLGTVLGSRFAVEAVMNNRA